MTRRHGNALRASLMFIDGGIATLVGLLVYRATAHPDVPFDVYAEMFWSRAVLYAAAWVGLLYLNGAYRLRAFWTLGAEARSVVRATFWLAALGLGALAVFGATEADRGYVLLLFPIQAAATIATRGALRSILIVLRSRGYNARNLVILGSGQPAVSFARTIDENRVLGVRVIGFLGDRSPDGYPTSMHLGTLQDFPRILHERVVDEVAVCVPPTELRLVERYARLAHREGKLVRVPLMVPRMESSARILEDLEGRAVLSFANGPDELAGLAFKRAFDIVVSCIAIVALSPLIVGIAAFLRVTQGPGIFFRQTRIGRHGRPFTIFKFRTMTRDAETRYRELAAMSHTRGAAFKMVGDPRITRSGRWLRRFSLDELPQFINVLRGDMSVVGPRPAPPREVEGYDLWHRRRLSVKPGITGLWQITARLDRDFDERAELDLRYIDNWSVWMDLAILLRTLPAVLRMPGH